MSKERQQCIFTPGCEGSLQLERERVHSQALNRDGVKKYIVCPTCREEQDGLTEWEAPEGAGTPKEILDGMKKSVGALEFSMRRMPEQWRTLIGPDMFEEAVETIKTLHERISGNVFKDERTF